MKKILNNKIIILVIILLIAAFLFFFFNKQKTIESDVIAYKGYTISDINSKIEKYSKSHTIEGYKGGDKAYYINGKIVSSIDKQFTIIEFDLYDKNDKILGNAVATLNEMKKGKEYRFKAVSLILEKKTKLIDHYRLKNIK